MSKMTMKQEYKDTAFESVVRVASGVKQATYDSVGGAVRFAVPAAATLIFAVYAASLVGSDRLPDPDFLRDALDAIGRGAKVGVYAGLAWAPVLNIRRFVKNGAGKLVQVGEHKYTRKLANRDFIANLQEKSDWRFKNFMDAFSSVPCADRDDALDLQKQFPQIAATLIARDLEQEPGKDSAQMLPTLIFTAAKHPELLKEITPEMVAAWIKREADKKNSPWLDDAYHVSSSSSGAMEIALLDMIKIINDQRPDLLKELPPQTARECFARIEQAFVKQFDPSREGVSTIRVLRHIGHAITGVMNRSFGTHSHSDQEQNKLCGWWQLRNELRDREDTLGDKVYDEARGRLAANGPYIRDVANTTLYGVAARLRVLTQ